MIVITSYSIHYTKLYESFGLIIGRSCSGLDEGEEVGKDVAMHVAFAKPQHLRKADVPAEVIERERQILAARAKESGKPAEIVAKMVEGGINKYLGEITLLGQAVITSYSIHYTKLYEL